MKHVLFAALGIVIEVGVVILEVHQGNSLEATLSRLRE